MKATGIVRRIDDLGRVVIPKEIRRTMRIREGDPLEIYTDRNGEVIFKKYSPMGELGTFVRQLCDALSRTAGSSCVICDRDSVIAASGSVKKDIIERSVSPALEQIMQERRMVQPQDGSVFVTGDDRYPIAIAAPIIAEGDVSGCVAFLDEEHKDRPAGEVESKLLQSAALFLGQQMTM
ncbi:MAG: stage V sporulation T C-terminal domain-containing protein [Butyricicoccus sp.]